MPVISTMLASTLPGVATYELGDFASLLVTATAVISADGSNAAALALGEGSSAFIRGTIFSAGNGIDASDESPDVDVVIAAGALVAGDERGVLLAGTGSRLENAGEIAGLTRAGVELIGAEAELVNTGLIQGGFSAVDVSGVNTVLTNAGMISGGAYGVQDFAGGLRLTNTGTIMTSEASSVALRIEKAGNTLVNTGSVLSVSNAAVMLGMGDTVGGGSNRLTNDGLIATTGSTAIAGGLHAELIVNTGTIIGGVMLDGAGDRFDGRGGLQGNLDGGSGNDTILGGVNDEYIAGGLDSDSLSGGGGDDTIDAGEANDTVRGGAGADQLNGGSGLDLLDYSLSAAGVMVDLASGDVAGGDSLDDEILGFEWVQGSGYADTLLGDGLANRLAGGTGADRIGGGLGADLLSGGRGGDSLSGGNGADTLVGGLGADTLAGGAGVDRFVYGATAESGAAQRDVIVDFTKGQDRIDLSAIDANAVGGTANDAFTLLTTLGATFTAPGQVRFVQVAGTTQVEANTDADATTAEMVIALSGLFTLVGADFVL